VEEGNFIYIYTTEELARIEEASRKLAHRVFTLDYITAQDADTFIKPMLSSAGSSTTSSAAPEGFEASSSDGGENSFANFETLIVHDYEENIEKVAEVIETLDVQPQQILIEATILVATLTEDLALGVDMSILASIGVDDLMSGVSPFTSAAQVAEAAVGNIPSGAINSTQVINPESSVSVGILTNSVQIFISALDEITDTTVLANPKITTLNRQRADVLVGGRRGYLSTTATTTSTTQTVEFLDEGTQLTVRPFISKDGMVRMEIQPKISDATVNNVGGTVIPDETTQELTTNVMVRDGQTIVLGGLFKDETTINKRQVPGLGDVPVVGNAFKGHNNEVTRTEVIFLITPHIVTDKVSAKLGAETAEGIEGVRVGAREGLLPWSRTKLTASHLRDALSHINAGNNEQALWEVDMALSINPLSHEARRLKNKLAGEGAYWPNASLLDHAVDKLVKDRTGKNPQSFNAPAPSTSPESTTEGSTEPAWEDEPVAQTIESTPAYSPEGFESDASESATAEASSTTKTIWPTFNGDFSEPEELAGVPTND
jgi:type IV pilus assembly protein PilQ